MPSSINRHIHCTSCSKGKMHIVPHSRNAWVEKAKHRHDAWHLDLIGKFRVPSLGGNSYVLTIIDNYSRYCTAIPIKDKKAATVLQAFKKCIAELQAKPIMVYTDWGTEFGGEFSQFCTNNSIQMEKSCAYRAWLNGLVERCNRSITNVAKTIMQQCHLPAEFWAHAVCTAAYTINRLSHIGGCPEGSLPSRPCSDPNRTSRTSECSAVLLRY